MRGRQAFLGALLVAILLVAISGCRSEPSGTNAGVNPDEVVSPEFDPALCCYDSERLVLRFDGESGPILTGRGWHRPEGGPSHPWGTYAWVQRRSSIYFPSPSPRDVEFVARCSPYSYPDAPDQSMRVTLNGAPLKAVKLQHRHWSEVRIPLPAARLRPEVNEIGLDFAYVARPSDKTDSADRRLVSAACRYVAIVPSAEPSSVFVQDRVHFDGETLRMQAGSATTFPLPAVRAARLRLGKVQISGDPTLSISTKSHNATRREVWRGPAAETKGLTLDLVGAEGDLSELLFELSGSGLGGAPSEMSLLLSSDSITPTYPEPPSGQQRPSVFVYMIDTLRADALGIYGAERPTSPFIDGFARDAVVFERAWSPAAWTLPATASVLTGLYPSNHGLIDMSVSAKAEDSRPSIAEMLGDLGYETIAVSQSYVASQAYGLERGFDSFYLNDVLGSEVQASGNVRWFLWQHLKQRPASGPPVFAYLHTVDPHHPYAPRGADARFARESSGWFGDDDRVLTLHDAADAEHSADDLRRYRALYDGEVLYADRQFGAFLDFLRARGIYEQSLILLVSDHGEEFGEHGGVDHGRALFEEMLDIPLIVKFPSSWARGARVQTRVSSVDIVPTILEVVGAQASPHELDGTSLRPLVRDSVSRHGRVVFSETRPGGNKDKLAAVDLSAVVQGDLKCVYTEGGVDKFFREVPEYRVFDLRVDPGERKAVEASARHPACAGLESFRPHAEAGGGTADPPRESVGEETRSRLRALGYLD